MVIAAWQGFSTAPALNKAPCTVAQQGCTPRTCSESKFEHVSPIRRVTARNQSGRIGNTNRTESLLVAVLVEI